MTLDIKALAKQANGTPYVNRHYPGETAAAFGPGALLEFVRLVRESALEEAANACLSRHANGNYVCDDRDDCHSAIKELMK